MCGNIDRHKVACRTYYPAAILLLSQLLCCSMWKNRTADRKDSLVLKQEQKLAEVTVKSNKNEIFRLIYSDSLKNTYWVQIIPEGEFSYSPEKGFSGRASLLQLSGNRDGWHSAGVSAASTSTVLIDSSSSHTLKEKTTSKVKAAVERKARWDMILIFAVVLILVFVYRKRVFV